MFGACHADLILIMSCILEWMLICGLKRHGTNHTIWGMCGKSFHEINSGAGEGRLTLQKYMDLKSIASRTCSQTFPLWGLILDAVSMELRECARGSIAVDNASLRGCTRVRVWVRVRCSKKRWDCIRDRWIACVCCCCCRFFVVVAAAVVLVHNAVLLLVFLSLLLLLLLFVGCCCGDDDCGYGCGYGRRTILRRVTYTHS